MKLKVRLATEILLSAAATSLVRVQLLHPGTDTLIPNCQVQPSIPNAPEIEVEFDVPDGTTAADIRYQGLNSDGITTIGPFTIPGATAQRVPAPPPAAA